MSGQHTPGPWAFRLEAVRTVIYHTADIGEKAIAVGAGSYPDHVANARLIASAPDLLEACEAALIFIANTRGKPAELYRGKLRKAIAKARGEQS